MCLGSGSPTQRGFSGQQVCGTCGQRVKQKNGLALDHPSKAAYDSDIGNMKAKAFTALLPV